MANEVRVTANPTLVELAPDPSVRVTELLGLVEMGPVGIYATSMVVLVEMEELLPCRPTTHVYFGGRELTEYCNSVAWSRSAAEKQKRPLNAIAALSLAGLSESQLVLKGDWNPTVDAVFGRAALRGTRTSSLVAFDDCSMRVVYAWADAFVTSWRPYTAANGKQEFEATIRHNGAGTRTVSMS